MRFNTFEIRVVLRVLLLAVSIFFCFYFWFASKQYLFVFLFLTATIIILVNLLRLVRKSNREIHYFLESIRNQDFSFQYSTGRSSNFSELHNEFNSVIQKFRKSYGKWEEQYQYLQQIIQHISVGLICVNSDGKVDMVNRSALKLLNLNSLKHFKELQDRMSRFTDAVMQTESGQKSLVKMHTDTQQLQLLIHVKEFRLGNVFYTLISLENISIELEEKEQKAWQDLIRVLMHEMMNSIAPITSLSDSMSNILNKEKEYYSTGSDHNTLKEAASTISRRGMHLMQFVKNYRELTRLPDPDLELTAVSELFDRIAPLYYKRAKEKGVHIKFDVTPPGLKMVCDPTLIEQAIINLVDNAFSALEETTDPKISVYARLRAGTVIISVLDNGPGIPEDIHEKVFIPFFTTKEMGNGIGLSLSKQIIRAHHGSINIYSDADQGTEIRIHLKA